MSPEQTQKTMTLGNTLAAELRYESISTRKMLERITTEILDWQPHTKSAKLGYLAQHIARLPSFVKPVLTMDEFDLATAQRPAPATSAAELVESFDQLLAEATEYLNNASDEDLSVAWKLRSGDHTIFEMPRAGVIRTLVLSHLIHHRGQLSVYMRLNDVPVPSIYGPSADEQ